MERWELRSAEVSRHPPSRVEQVTPSEGRAGKRGRGWDFTEPRGPVTTETARVASATRAVGRTGIKAHRASIEPGPAITSSPALRPLAPSTRLARIASGLGERLAGLLAEQGCGP